MFDLSQPFKIEIESGGVISCRLNFPTDKQWIDRTRKQKTLIVDLGHGKTRTDSTNMENYDSDLFEKIRIEGDPFDKYEASLAIAMLSKGEIESCEKDSEGFTITMTVFGGVETVHRLKLPKRADLVEYDRGAVQRINDSKSKVASIWVELESSGKLYDKLLVSTEGYAAGTAVPLIHKTRVISELNEANSPEV